jgi:hypothetical protein
MSTDQQFQQADAVVERAVAIFMGAIDRLMGRFWEDVAPQYILKRVLLQLCEELTKRD